MFIPRLFYRLSMLFEQAWAVLSLAKHFIEPIVVDDHGVRCWDWKNTFMPRRRTSTPSCQEEEHPIQVGNKCSHGPLSIMNHGKIRTKISNSISGTLILESATERWALSISNTMRLAFSTSKMIYWQELQASLRSRLTFCLTKADKHHHSWAFFFSWGMSFAVTLHPLPTFLDPSLSLCLSSRPTRYFWYLLEHKFVWVLRWRCGVCISETAQALNILEYGASKCWGVKYFLFLHPFNWVTIIMVLDRRNKV